MNNFAVFIPVLNRPQNVKKVIDSLFSTTEKVNLYFIVNDWDKEEFEEIKVQSIKYSDLSKNINTIVVKDNEIVSWARKINFAFNRTFEKYCLLGADDIKFHKNWLEEALYIFGIENAISHHPIIGVVGTNDLGNFHTIYGLSSTHPIINREYIIRYNGYILSPEEEKYFRYLSEEEKYFKYLPIHNKVLYEGYRHIGPDTELCKTAQKRGMYKHAYKCIIEHLHPVHGKSETDDTYKLGHSFASQDQALYQERAKRLGFDDIVTQMNKKILF